MATEKIDELYLFIFKTLRGKKTYNPTDADAATLFSSIIDVNVDDKADKVEGAVLGHFAGLDADGNLTDSGKNSGSFAAASHNHNLRYLRLDANNAYDADTHVFTWVIDSGQPFEIDNTSGEVPDTVTHLNADYLDGVHASAFAVAGHNHDGRYLRLNGDTEYDADAHTFTWVIDAGAPFLIDNGSGDIPAVITWLNADYLRGKTDEDFAAAVHDHDDRYYTIAEVNDALDTKLDQPGSATNGRVAIWNASKEVIDGGTALAALALASDVAGKADKVLGASPDNFASFDGSGNLLDSGYTGSSFATADHTHDVLTNDLKINTDEDVVSTKNVTGGTTTPNGTLTIKHGGTTHYVLTAATS